MQELLLISNERAKMAALGMRTHVLLLQMAAIWRCLNGHARTAAPGTKFACFKAKLNRSDKTHKHFK